MATTYKYPKLVTSKWTYGAELELVDWPRRLPLPVKGMAIDDGNYTSVNSNGIAVDGKGKTYHLGGEILTAPTSNPEDQAEQLLTIKKHWPETTFNYRTGLNTHVRVPGLIEDLTKLKQLTKFINKVMPELLPIIDPIPKAPLLTSSKREKQCRKIRLKDHHTLLPDWRLQLQLKATTVKEFFEAEAIHLATGKVHWAIVPRNAVNLRQLLQTETIEFRHWFMPANEDELLNTVLWSKLFLEAAFDGGSLSATDLLREFGNKALPKPLPYNAWLDEGWHYTSPKHYPPEIVAKHIQEWLDKNKGA